MKSYKNVRWNTRETEDQIHIWPKDDLIEHDDSPDCPCDPLKEMIDKETGKEIWVHFPNCAME